MLPDRIPTKKIDSHDHALPKLLISWSPTKQAP
jgi:hypothetical protein